MRHAFKDDYEGVVDHVRNIRELNKNHAALLLYFFNHSPNMLMPTGVREELQAWIDHNEVDAYYNWRNNGELSFSSAQRNERFSEVSDRPFYMMTYDAQYEYLQMLDDFLKAVPRDNQVDFTTDPRKELIMQALSKNLANREDRDIFADAYLATFDTNGTDLYVVSFDLGMRDIAREFVSKGLNQGIGIHVLNGYGMVKPKKRGPEYRRMETLLSTAA